jgi:hypothetical protein
MSDIVERLLSASHDERLSDGMLYREAGEILQACKPYLKDGETPAECIQRNRSDVGSVMSLLAKEKFRIEAVLRLADEMAKKSGDGGGMWSPSYRLGYQDASKKLREALGGKHE